MSTSDNSADATTQDSNLENQKETEISGIENIQIELETEKNKRLVLMADFDNYKKRVELEKATFGAIANKMLIEQILEVSDDLQFVIDDQEVTIESTKESIKSAQSKISGLVKMAGVEMLEIKKGDDFDKTTMEAIQTVESGEFRGKVLAVISSAYRYIGKDSVIKPAKVIVGK